MLLVVLWVLQYLGFFQFLTLIGIDYFEASWPRPIHDESKHACNGERECF